MKRLFVLSGKERGFTLAEVIVAMAIISFVVLATWRVITSSLHSITRQDQKVKALHISQAHLARLEAETFSRVVPENCKIPRGPEDKYEYTLSIYDEGIPYNKILIELDDDYWYDTDGLGFYDTGQDRTDGLLVADRAGTPYGRVPASPPPKGYFYWDAGKMTLHFRRDPDVEQEVQIYYRYYHLVDEGGTIPSSSGEGLKERIIKLVTTVGDTNGDGESGKESDILGMNLTRNEALDSSDYDSFDPQTGELTFIDTKQEDSVWIYYLPDSDTDSSGPEGIPDGYLDPTENSIVGVVAGNFWDLDQGAPPQPPRITKTKKIAVTQYWKQGGKIQEAKQEAYIVDR